MNRHIHFLGASGSGTTTLARELSKLLGRSLAMHNEWLKRMNCRVIRLEGPQSVEERIRAVFNELDRKK